MTRELVPEISRITRALAEAGTDEFEAFADAPGFELSVTSAGDRVLRWAGKADPSEGVVRTGGGARSVGLLGVLEGLRMLRDAGFEPRRTIEVVAAGNAVGGEGFADPQPSVWVELGVDTSGRLERQGVPVGIAVALAASARWQVTAVAPPDHLRITPMPERRDALYAAAEAIGTIEQLARSSPSPDLVAVVSNLACSEPRPGAGLNEDRSGDVLPEQVRFTLELRDTDAANRDQTAEAIRDEVATLAQRRGLRFEIEPIGGARPVACDKAVIDAAEAGCDAAGVRWWKMLSRDDHQAVARARDAAVGVVLVAANRSERTDETLGFVDGPVAAAALSAGVEVVAHTLAGLSRSEG
ncbi:MAG: hypothetical protein AAGG38_00775 [Planctomycetota bacterium]